MPTVLYQKYRPKNFSEIIGQDHIVRTLSNSIKNGRVAQAYLFTGPRGTGKTSIARIFAKTINCEKIQGTDPCEKCPSCSAIGSGKSLDIIEIDAASNTGVDNIRELRETVALANASLKYKVYIIDEVHMLSGGAFNALLKTLEEPPAHVIFILATTEIHKVPETIISRCQRFDFVRLPLKNIVEKLSLIAKLEKVSVEKEALESIAIAAEGGMRDAESLLGQIISLEDKNITAKEVQEILGIGDKTAVRDFCRKILERKPSFAIEIINRILEDGDDLEVFAKSALDYLRQIMLLKINPELKKYFSFEMTAEESEKTLETAKNSELADILSAINFLLEGQKEITSSPLPQLPLEIAVIKATEKFPADEEQKIKTIENKTWSTEQKEKNMHHETPGAEKKKKESERNNADLKSINNSDAKESAEGEKGKLNLEDVLANWKKLLADIRPYNHSLSALLMSCVPIGTEKNILTLATPYDFYQERLNDAKNRLTVEEVFSKILGSKISIRVSLDKSLCERKDPSEEMPSVCQQNPLLDDALEIMGGKIVE